jgi:NitT/TauT family transport system permease protein
MSIKVDHNEVDHKSLGERVGRRQPAVQTAQDRRSQPMAVAAWKKLASRWPILSTVVIIFGLLWWGSLSFPSFIFPTIPGIISAFTEVIVEEHMTMLLTLRRFAVALLASACVGWLIGLLMGAFRRTIGRLTRPIVSFVQSVPALSWVLLAVLWISDVETRIFLITFVVPLPFFVISVYEGIRDMDKDMLQAVEQFRPTRMQVLTKLLIPQSITSVIMSFRFTMALALKVMVFAELIAASTGVGQQFGIAQQTFRIDLLFAWTGFLVIANYLMIALVDLIEKKALSWRQEAVVR